MTDYGAGGGQYVTYREHIAAKEEAQKRAAAVEMEVATMRAALMHLPDDVRKLTEAVNALPSKMPQQAPQSTQADQTLLAMHRLIDAYAAKSGGGGQLMDRIVWAVVSGGGAAAIMYFAR